MKVVVCWTMLNQWLQLHRMGFGGVAADRTKLWLMWGLAVRPGGNVVRRKREKHSCTRTQINNVGDNNGLLSCWCRGTAKAVRMLQTNLWNFVVMYSFPSRVANHSCFEWPRDSTRHLHHWGSLCHPVYLGEKILVPVSACWKLSLIFLRVWHSEILA